MSDESAITITISTTQGWDEIARNVRAAEAAAAAAGGDVLVADGSRLPRPPAHELGTRIRWIEKPGASVFQLRMLSYATVTAPIVVVTEDHCVLPPDFALRHVAAHHAHPEAAAIGGSVLNGATASVFDWASFFVVQARQMAPIPSGPVARIAGAVNASYKLEALRWLDAHGGLGAMDILHQRELVAQGQTLIADDTIRLAHDQSLGFVGTVLIHFHAGRTVAAFRRDPRSPAQLARLAATPVVPAARFARIASLVVQRGYGRHLPSVAPGMWLLLVTQTVGQVIGFLAGPGDSPRQVQ